MSRTQEASAQQPPFQGFTYQSSLSRFSDKDVQRDLKLLPYKIINKEGKPNIEVKLKDGEVKVFSPEEISAMVLIKMKETAEAYLGKKIKDAVVTVPGENHDQNPRGTIGPWLQSDDC